MPFFYFKGRQWLKRSLVVIDFQVDYWDYVDVTIVDFGIEGTFHTFLIV